MKHEEAVGEPTLPANIVYDIDHPEEAPQLVHQKAQWDTITLLGMDVGYDDWLAWHFAAILGLRYP